MKILVIMHVDSEGPGTLGEFLESAGVRVETVRLYNGQRLPRDVHSVGAVVTMGGPMNVYEEERYPFLREDTEFLREAIRAGTPVLGICLGAQMVAKACGVPVFKAPVKEIGWSEVSLTEEGRCDELFRGVPPKLRAFQWHEDTFEIPPGGSLLGTSEVCRNQAFRVANAYGLQFHVEVTRDMLVEWFAESNERIGMIRQFEEIKSDLLCQARKVYAAFVALSKRNTELTEKFEGAELSEKAAKLHDKRRTA